MMVMHTESGTALSQRLRGEEWYTLHQGSCESSNDGAIKIRTGSLRGYAPNMDTTIQSISKLHLVAHHQTGFCPVLLGFGESFDALLNRSEVMLHVFPN